MVDPVESSLVGSEEDYGILELGEVGDLKGCRKKWHVFFGGDRFLKMVLDVHSFDPKVWEGVFFFFYLYIIRKDRKGPLVKVESEVKKRVVSRFMIKTN